MYQCIYYLHMDKSPTELETKIFSEKLAVQPVPPSYLALNQKNAICEMSCGILEPNEYVCRSQ